MTDADDINALAAEYVLGTLDAAERASVAARRTREPELDRAITGWEARLAPLNDASEDVAPPRDLFQKIEARLDGQVTGTTNVVDLQRRLGRWRTIAIAASSIAAALVAFISVREVQRPEPPGVFVASFQKDDSSPAFLITVDIGKRTLSLRPVDAKPPEGKTYQLWIVHESWTTGPRSLGLIDAKSQDTRAELPDLPAAIIEKATFGVSIEPPGGSPTGKPTGPALHAKLVRMPS